MTYIEEIGMKKEVSIARLELLFQPLVNIPQFFLFRYFFIRAEQFLCGLLAKLTASTTKK